jgi:hypothetical protein
MAQQKPTNYILEWKKVDSLLNKKGLNKSALTAAENLYQTAKKENQSAQTIKALIYIAAIKEPLSENAEIENIETLQKELKSAKTPVSNLLHSLLANQYKNYYNNHRWKYYDQTHITAKLLNLNPNLDTWSAEDFSQTISYHFEQSLLNQIELVNTRIDDFSPIIIKGNGTNLRPTLFDLISWNALNFFSSGEIQIIQPAYQFTISDTIAFADVNQFINHQFISEDTQSSKWKATKLYQSILQLHSKDADPSALIDADLQRLAFVFQTAVLPSKSQLYQNALEQIFKKYPTHPFGALAKFKATNLFYENTNEINLLTATNAIRFARKTIANTLRDLIKNYPKTNAAIESENLLNVIENPELSVQTENVVLHNQPFLSLVKFKNVSKIYYKIISITNNKKLLEDHYITDQQWKKWCNSKPVRDSFQLLPDAGDYRTHTAEIKMDALPTGAYALIASTSPDFKLQKNALCIQFFQASSIGFVNRGDDYFFLHRKTGKPIPKLAVQIWESVYDYKLSKQILTKKEKLITNKDGFIQIKRHEGFQIEAYGDKDTLITKDYLYPRFNYEGPELLKKPVQGLLFTDRKIYRPGQPLYFKGIFYNDLNKSNKTTASGFAAEMVLINANGEEIDSIKLVSNAFGSVQGQFHLPTNQLTGSFQIREKNTGASFEFNVEEYKRPTFQVLVDKIKKAYRLGDTVHLTGSIMAFAGNTLNGTTVKYRVTRMPRYNWYWSSSHKRGGTSATLEIEHGTIITDAQGHFNISFLAKSEDDGTNNSIYEDYENKVFDFLVSVEATDQSGETNFSETQLTISTKSLQLEIKLPKNPIGTADFTTIPVAALNTFGETQQIKAELTIQALASPQRPLKPRYWDVPDTSIYSKDEFIIQFPFDPFMDETNPETWKTTNTVYQSSDTLHNGKIILPKNQFIPGWYLIKINTKDEYGALVSEKTYVRLYDSKNPMPDASSFAESLSEDKTTTPGETISLSIGSQSSNYWLITHIDNEEKTIQDAYTQEEITSKRKTVSLPITEADRGGFTVMYATILHNRIFTLYQRVEVPWTNKMLEVKTSSFRNKTEPGSKETWTLNITSNHPENQKAEVLTSLYDASLDQFVPHQWQLPDLYLQNDATPWSSNPDFGASTSVNRDIELNFKEVPETMYNRLLWEGSGLTIGAQLRDQSFGLNKVMVASESKMMPLSSMTAGKMIADSAVMTKFTPPKLIKDEEVKAENINTNTGKVITPRKNFTETAFFIPQLITDSLGNVQFSFTMPDALTQWKWQSFAHTKEMAFGKTVQQIITQKELMVQPNMPRILREGDKITLTARVSNLTDKEISGMATLDLIDPETDKPVDGLFKNIFPQQFFTIEAGQNGSIGFTIEIPINYNKPVKYKIIAISGTHSDGEENTIAVLSNRILVTESIPLTIKGNGTADFNLSGLTNSKTGTLTHHRLTFEYSANPAWNAILALPYLMEFPYECAEQNFNRFYANALASSIANSSPRIKAIFDQWKSKDTAALISNLLKNQELKSILIEETPWVFEAQQESIQRKNIARLFDMIALSKELTASLEKLKNMQSENGAFPWFKGCPDDRFITQYIVTGIAKLLKMQTISNPEQLQTMKGIVFNALHYLDYVILKDYSYIKKQKFVNSYQPSCFQLQYLYMNSFYRERTTEKTLKQALDYFTKQLEKTWVKQNLMGKAMVAIIASRNKNEHLAKDILRSLKETSIVSPTLGMYWKENKGGYFWQESPIETQALAIDAFQEITKDTAAVEPMLLWLMNQKKVQHWSTSKATADAIYAILNSRPAILVDQPNITINAGNIFIQSEKEKQEAGTGYFKSTIEGKDVQPEMGQIKVSVSGGSAKAYTWGAAHWQYFEVSDKLSNAGGALKVKKEWFINKNTDRGIILEPIEDSSQIKVGDKLTIRLTIYAEQDLEYVHLKDVRPVGTAPVEVISGYQWKNGVGYYKTTTDVGNNFFFNWLPKGTQVIDYDLFVSHSGRFSMGVSTIQSMYAPEYNGRSAVGIIKIGE